MRYACGPRILTWSALAIVVVATTSFAQSGAPNGEWPSFGGDPGNTKYSALDQINRANFDALTIAWRWTSISQDVTKTNEQIRAGQFKATPLMVDGLVYVSTALSQVAAIDAGTGRTVWQYDPKSYETLERPANLGWQHRGVAYWSDGRDARILIATHDLKLVALNAKTGRLYPDFGNNGTVDLSQSLDRPIDTSRITHSSPVAIARDTVIVGSVIADRTLTKEAPPGHVRGFDVRSGRRKWIFHTIPQAGEFGADTWENDSWEYSGHTNVWSFMAVDSELGYVYLPTGTPTNDSYGGHRLGDNLFAESIICLNAETGERVWHFQAVHHGLWDYDFPTAPNLLDITVDGRQIKALAQVSKQAFTYVFDRITGEPVWPIEERPVPQSTVPGERASPTQPFPTKPAPFDRQGITEDDLIDFTPALRAEALDILKRAQLASLFTPPTTLESGTPVINLPGDGGGANWPGAAVDPETGHLYVPSSTTPKVFSLVKHDPDESNLDWAPQTWSTRVPGPQGLPLVKPPYTRITAIDLNSGDHVWQIPHGDGPRDHRALRDLDLPPLGGGGSRGPLVTKTLVVVTSGGRDVAREESARQLTFYDKASGQYLGSVPLPAAPNGNPITYLHEGKQYIAVAVGGGSFRGGGGVPPELIALSLP